MSYLSVANSLLVYVASAIGILLIAGICLIFLKKSWERALEIGITREEVVKIVRSSAIFSIVPSIAVVIGIFALSPIIGIPWSWFRLSVIGSVAGEMISADFAVRSIGMSIGDLTSGTADAFGIIAFMMTLAAVGGTLTALIFGKSINKNVLKLGATKVGFNQIALGSIMIALLAVFIPGFLLGGMIPTLTFATSVIVSLIQGWLIKKHGMLWLKDFVLAFSLLIGMFSAVLWTSLF